VRCAGTTGAPRGEHDAHALPSPPAVALGNRCLQRAARGVRVSPQRDDETEPMTRLFGARPDAAAPAREQPPVPFFKARGRARLVVAAMLAAACLGAGAWLMQ